MAHTELDDRVVAFLTEGTRTGKVAFVSASGRALVAPIWFIVDNGVLVFNTGADTAKGRALSRDRRLTILVDDERPPFSFVQVQGTAEIGEDPEDLLDTATRIAARYMGPDLAEAYGKRNAVPGELVVRVTPTKVNAVFDIAD
ncbi:PPOX class F420-dependent oxidoreductase [Gordonia sp. L191]|uniref:PPOX class F420-dependent oxidoreductase n=1 Tax=Gordonia TaxID=2053 RepID=UPI001AD6105A|nr:MULTISPECIES: PPOX class F420-dependent oxidoreductase [Gordonia]QTI69516.1 PPOX class F420-dependent oxidoreductase [Gordonia polyisoprenivorans]WHU46975.1 PPOX class F420-dependent oxidoreductase [Gordonia sp. L191]